MAVTQWQNPVNDQRRMPFIKKLFWAYFLLLIFEGALRKWILPQYSAPLLLVRDPIAVLIIIEAYRTNKWPARWSAVTGALAAGLIALCVIQVVVNNNPWVAAVYGLRSYLLPFPVAFIMGESLDEKDLRMFSLCTLWLLLPETAIAVAQYVAPASSFVNAAAYSGAAQIGYVGQHVRASGTFSYVIGLALYGPLAAAFILYGLVQQKSAHQWLLWAAGFALILSVPVTGSRTLLFELAGVIVCAGVAAAFGLSQFQKSLKILVPLLAVFVLASFLPVFSESAQSFNERFSEANETEGGGNTGLTIAHRTVIPIATRLEQTNFAKDPFGLGMGRGAAAVSAYLEGSAKFEAGENDIDRAIIELGPVPGIIFTLFRFALALTVLVKAFLKARKGDALALLLAPLMFSEVTIGILEQTTDQGFMVVALAFSLAALKKTEPQTARALSPGVQRRVMRYSMHA
jgi:hypothetical protein